MRPLRLAFQAFGPFADEQLIDFRVLDGRSLFLIHGPTGSGKSSILDAICFALYGETSGGERESSQLRSHLADPGVPTEVTFDFCLGEKVYRIFRSPEQDRPKKRGGGTTKARARATLWRRDGLEEADGEGMILAGQWSKVTEETIRLLGFRSRQFRQVMMLPQGKFLELLSAGSRDRQAILEVLFQTEIYRRIEEALKTEARKIRGQAEDLEKEKQIVFEHATVRSERELREKQAEITSRLGTLEARLKDLRTREKKAGEQWHEALETKKKLEEVQQAEAAFGVLLNRKGVIDAMEERLDRARKASALDDVESELKKRGQELEVATENRKVAEGAHEGARKEELEAGAALRKEREWDGRRERLRIDLDRLEKIRDGVEGLMSSKKELGVMLDEAARLEERKEKQENTLARLRGERRRARNDRDDAQKTAARKDYRMKALLEAEDALEKIRRLRMLKEERSSISKIRDERLARSRRFEEKLKQARDENASLEKTWHGAQAALLARDLLPGVPCPVCGSKEHPAPASFKDAFPQEGSLEKTLEWIKELERRREEARLEGLESEKDVIRVDSELHAIEKGLGSEALAPGLPEKRISEAMALLDESEVAERRVKALDESIASLEGKESLIRSELASTEKALRTVRERRAGIESVVGERETKIPEDLRTSEALEIALSRVRAQREAGIQALEEALKRHELAVRDLSAKEEAFKTWCHGEALARQRAGEVKEAFARRLQAGGFRDEAAFQASRLDGCSMKKLEQEVQEFAGSLGAARERVRRAREAATGLKEPDILFLENEVERLKSVLEERGTERGTAIQQSRQVAEWLEALERIKGKRTGLDTRYAALGKIADVAGGANPLGITFQRFVLAALLDDVLVSASHRLRRMSGGRYALQRARARADQRSAGGLDLEVFDAYTGTSRLVNTLSGGEGFLASLSLALGLADVVQSYAGGIHLETIFVDEGFGSLDDETLDLAFRALTDLQGDGRLVGIISHVRELKERIDMRLEVIPGRRGSMARFEQCST